jgi:hypothetical protein
VNGLGQACGVQGGFAQLRFGEGRIGWVVGLRLG